ncbi:MAG: succinate dehydrogenase flavoprotein subunit, succinate dehydrogenase flavoprotein subunit [Armatimonadetes bacterium CSP1-3]|nr:MAG: succinate dehydrogenase flavoprotein subunit, succinate dehydrogenase flavoprotein subunit [Armatimonadetes bacterium CSP1-3]
MDTVTHDLVIFGAGLAGLRAALAAASASRGKLDIALVSKVQLMRAHSVAAEGGTAAVLRPEEGDSLELHAWDTVKGSDFLADQDAVELFVRTMPEEILHLEHWGLPWSRRPDGRIAQRPFGGHSFPRAVYAADKTGFFEMQTLYDTLQRHAEVTRYDECFVTALVAADNVYRGLIAIDMKSGRMLALRSQALIIASGGAGRLYNFTTYSQTVTGDGLALAFRAGAPLKDMEFVQFHPTGLVPSGILISEAARGDGGYLINKDGERFLERYAPQRMELAPRDIISRSMMTEIEAGRAYPRPDGLDHLLLDLRHLGAAKINERLPFIRELAIKFGGIDPIEQPIPVRPVAHYSMGGIHTDLRGATPVRGIWAAGEAACVSIHGANRLGTNSTAECLAWGRFAGEDAARFAAENALPPLPEGAVADEERRLHDLLRTEGTESPYEIRAALQETMDRSVGVFRTGEGLTGALAGIKELADRARRLRLADRGRVYNTDLITCLELQNMLEIAEVVVAGALARTESRGAQARRDFPNRDDQRWLIHTMAARNLDGPRLGSLPVAITRWEPVERTY